LPLRLGMRAGKTRDRVETPGAMEEGRALAWEGVHGIVAASKAESRRTCGLGRAKGLGLGPLGPRPWAVRHALEAWGQPPPAFPLCVEKPGRTKDEGCRRWHGQSVIRPVAVEYRDGGVTQEALRCLVGPARHLAPQHPQTYASAHAQAAEASTAHVQRVHARWLAWAAEAAAAIAESPHQAPGRRGRHPHPWRDHAGRSRGSAAPRRRRRAPRGRPAPPAPPPPAAGSRLGGDVAARANPEEAHGWRGLAPTVPAEGCGDTDLLRASQAPKTTGEPGFRGSTNPAAIAPVWLEQPARLAAVAMLTVSGFLGESILPRQGRL